LRAFQGLFDGAAQAGGVEAEVGQEFGALAVLDEAIGDAAADDVAGPRSPKSTPENLGELSKKDVMNVLALVRKDFTIDEKRIHLMGHSMGGGGTWHLAPGPEASRALGRPGPDRAGHLSQGRLSGKNQAHPRDPHSRRQRQAGARHRRPPLGRRNEKTQHDLRVHRSPRRRHVDVAFQNLPRIFEFFEKQQKREKQ
jgi:hypothetical protein